jgi:hypothetical protein
MELGAECKDLAMFKLPTSRRRQSTSRGLIFKFISRGIQAQPSRLYHFLKSISHNQTQQCLEGEELNRAWRVEVNSLNHSHHSHLRLPLILAAVYGLSNDAVFNAAVVDSVKMNPIVINAIHILDQFSDLGKAMPFVAPAFVILKIIIDIERNARDVDSKCSDLLERISFMLGHLSALKHVQVMDATRRVIERMNGVLKTAASLIEAYRKQGPIARRLNINNRDKFYSCAESIKLCCTDLMMSLHINQTGQLDILTRSVPVDPEDEVAQIFLTSHGGVDAVKADRKLVTQFADQLHLKMDDEVMKQINTNLAQVMQNNQAQLEEKLNDTVGNAVVDGFKGLVFQMNEAEKEQVFKCVQCDQEFRESKNSPTSCSFHRAEYSSWNKSYPCCSTSHPCQFQRHRASHHCEYPYGSFFQRSRNILNYVDTVETWAEVKDTDLVNDNVSKASIGRLLRWVSRGHRLEEATILVTVGTVWYPQPYFFDTFTVKEFEAVSETVRATRNTVIFRTSPSESEFAMAEWVLSAEGTINAVRLTAKAATSDLPYVRVCPIDTATCTRSGDIIALSDGGLRSYTPDSPYTIPRTIRISPELDDRPLRPARTNFITRTSSTFPVVLKTMSEPPLKANPRFANKDSDHFEGVVSVFNKHPPGSLNPITIASVSASFRLVGDQDYTPVKSLKILDSQLPITVDPRQSCTLKFQVTVPRSDEDAQLEVTWWDRAFISRHRPLRLKLSMQDIEGEEASLVLEHVFNPFPLQKRKKDDLGFFYFDDPITWNRQSVSVENYSDGVIRIGSKDIDAKRLEKIVYSALKTGETEVDLSIGQEQGSGDWDWGAWALVDLSCRRVYAFKILLKQGRRATKHTFGCLGYVLCPNYGDIINESRPIRYALETVKLPDLEPFLAPEVVTDDTVDDVVPEPPKPAAESTAPSGSSAQMVLPEDLNRRLTSIESNLSRIATALEQLVDIFTKTNVR